MKRRSFLKSSLAATSVAGLAPMVTGQAAQASSNPAREFYELRMYHLRRGPKQKLFDDFYREAAVPRASLPWACSTSWWVRTARPRTSS